MEVDASRVIASIEKTTSPDPKFSKRDKYELWGKIEHVCEEEERYIRRPTNTGGALYPICIGDVIHHPGGRYEIVHRLGKGGFSVVWLARDTKRNTCVALKVMVAGAVGEEEFVNQRLLKETAGLDKSRLNLYQDTFLLTSPYNKDGKAPTIFHRVLVLPLEGPSLKDGDMRFDRSLRSRMTAANSLLEALRDLHQAGFVHGDISEGNVLWSIDHRFARSIALSPTQELGAPTERLRLSKGEGLKSGHRVVPAKFPHRGLGRVATLADYGMLVPSNGNTFDSRGISGTPHFCAPERFHGHDPSPATDMWSFMVVFVYLYLGNDAFPCKDNINSSCLDELLSNFENLGPLPAEWSRLKWGSTLYAPSDDVEALDPPKSKFASRLRENWEKDVTSSLRTRSDMAKKNKDPEAARIARRLEKELKVKKEAEPHALNVIHSIFRYEPGRRLTAEQLLTDPDWIKLMDLCGVKMRRDKYYFGKMCDVLKSGLDMIIPKVLRNKKFQ